MERAKSRWNPCRTKRRLGLLLGLSLASVFANGAFAADPLESKAADHIALVELSHRYAWGIDTNDREMLSKVFTSDATAHYVEVGEKVLDLDVRLEGFDAIWEWLHAGLADRKGPAGLPWHFMSNHLVEIEGDAASMTWYMHNRKLAAGGVYYVDAVRTPAGWRIARLRLEEQTWKPEAYRDRVGEPSLRSRPD